MTKLDEARAVLHALGLPAAQRNEMAALTLLVLAQLSEDTSWQAAARPSLRVHDILVEIKSRFDRGYAENTRETVRRQVLHQFEQAGIVLRNPDEPTLATNSPRTHYALTTMALQTLQVFGTSLWEEAVETFRNASGSLTEAYQKRRQQHRVPLIYLGKEYALSLGKHNELQIAIVNEFGPRFAPGARLLYLGDTENKRLILDETGFRVIGVPVLAHDKLPDIILYDELRNWLFLIEAVTSHGSVSHKRYHELETAFQACSAGRIYVSAFPDFGTFRNFLSAIAWDTEVWLSETPDHLIHFNGDRFLGPHTTV